MSTKHRNWFAWFLDALGVIIVGGEVIRAWVWNHRMEPGVIAVGCVFGFIGFYLTNPPGALAAGTFLVDSTVKIVGVVRSGRRASDPIVPQAVVAPKTDPPPPPPTAPPPEVP